MKPVFRTKRKVLFLALDLINEELERLEKIGIISKVGHSDWAFPTVYIKKKNRKIKECADFSTGFSKLDLSEAYLQVKVNEECLKYLIINMHKRIFKLSCLLFGLKVAPSLFQQIMDSMLAGMEYTIAYLDDNLIKSENDD